MKLLKHVISYEVKQLSVYMGVPQNSYKPYGIQYLSERAVKNKEDGLTTIQAYCSTRGTIQLLDTRPFL